MPRLQERYKKEILPALAEKLGRTNRLSLPRLQKIVVNMGVGKAIAEKKHLEEAVDALTQITGQKPLITQSRKAIAGFKLREGMAIGCKVTLRGRRMYEFLDRLISLALPRVRDFRGLNPKRSTATATTAWACRSSWCFPELNPDKFTASAGDEHHVRHSAPTATTRPASCCAALGMPFQARDEAGEARRAASAIGVSRRDDCRRTRDVDSKQTDCMASKSKIAKAQRTPKFSTRAGAALPAVRPAAGRVSQVRHLPDLLPQAGRPRA